MNVSVSVVNFIIIFISSTSTISIILFIGGRNIVRKCGGGSGGGECRIGTSITVTVTSMNMTMVRIHRPFRFLFPL